MSDEGSSTARPSVGEGSETQFPDIVPEVQDIESVIVFDGIAEVTRNIKVSAEQIPEAGEYNIVVKGVPKKLLASSVRVNGAKGAATILEVIPKMSKIGDEEVEKLTGKVKDAHEKMKELTKQADVIIADMGVIQESLQWLDGWSKNISETPSAEPLAGCPPPKPFLDESYLGNVGNFIEFYAKQTLEKKKALLVQQRKLTEVCKDIIEQINILISAGYSPLPQVIDFRNSFASRDRMDPNEVKKKMGPLRTFAGNTEFAKRFQPQSRPGDHMDIYVHIRAEKSSKIVFKLVYNVEGGSWNADYTARITEGKTLQLTYSAMVRNATGEDWKNVKLALSTAVPSSVSEPEQPGAIYVNLQKEPEEDTSSGTRSAGMMFAKSAPNAVASKSAIAARGVQTTSAARGMVSSLFSVPLKTTIAADGASHKVAITVIEEMAVTFEYVLYPRTSGNSAYIHILGKNSSEFSLLPGECGVFIDGSFVTQSSLKYIPVDGEFDMYCGIDNDIHVEYTKPVLVKEKKGVVMKTNVENYVGSFTVRNDKETAVKIIFKEPVPLSSDETLVVKVKKPAIEEGGKASIDPANNFLVWTATIDPGKEEKVELEISVDYPKGKRLTYTGYY